MIVNFIATYTPEIIPLLRIRSPGIITEANGTVLLKNSASSFMPGVGQNTSNIFSLLSISTASADITTKNTASSSNW